MAGERIEELRKRVEKQCRTLGSLAESLEGEDKFRQLLKRVERQCETLSSLASGGVIGGGFVLSLKLEVSSWSIWSLSVMSLPTQETC